VDITCISDLHGFYPKLEGGDLLIVAGDLTASDTQSQHKEFFEWLDDQEYDAKVYIAGNHDGYYQKSEAKKYVYPSGILYLEDQCAEFEGLKIWGSPWTHLFPGVNPHCTAFMIPEKKLAAKWALIPDDVDILVTHGPPFTVLDKTKKGAQVGSPSLMAAHLKRLRPKLWVFGHIHEAYGEDGPYEWNDTLYVNASIMNECYEPVNKPIGVVL
jgi:Icc-related predicted phosphoesterase